VFSVVVILTGVRWNLSMVLIFISFVRVVSIFSFSFLSFFLPFELLPLKKFCLVQLPISLLGHWLFESLVFWSPCIWIQLFNI
jgi:hypothetical protein